MISETLATGLAEYRLGAKVRTLRKGKRLGLVQLGEHTGLSPGLLSKIERGQIVPTLPTLLRIALVFGVGLEHFFIEEERPAIAVVRRSDRLRLPDRADAKDPSYFFESLDFRATDRRMDAFLAEFPSGAAASEPHRHPGAEFVYVVAGTLAIGFEQAEVVLEAGDASYFDAGLTHGYQARGEASCTAIVVVAG
jgi:transcriptional regulator with XRE-family HTH domain